MRRFCVDLFASVGNVTMRKRIEDYIIRLNGFKSIVAKLQEQYKWPRWCFYLDAFLCRIILGTNTNYYFMQEMYKMNWLERNQYINDTRTVKVRELFNSYTQRKDEVTNKVIFNTTIKEYINREWMYAPDHTVDEIEAFLRRHDAIIVKPVDATAGKGVEKILCSEALNNLDEFVGRVQEKKLLMEEFIKQHSQMSEINPSSVNTLRITTVREKTGKVHVIAASLRAGGKDQVVDNLHADGVQYPIDVQTGLIIRGGTKYDGTRDVYFHPSTNKQMIGFQVPNWETVIRTVESASQVPEGIRYLGWDIAVTEDGCDIVEANISQGCNGMQLDGVGKYYMIMKYL